MGAGPDRGPPARMRGRVGWGRRDASGPGARQIAAEGLGNTPSPDRNQFSNIPPTFGGAAGGPPIARGALNDASLHYTGLDGCGCPVPGAVSVPRAGGVRPPRRRLYE